MRFHEIIAESRYEQPYRYVGNCTNEHCADHLEDMMDNAREVSYATLAKAVGVDLLQEVFPSYDWNRRPRGLTLRKDWAVSYYKSTYDGVPCYYVDHSAIEYIFVPSSYRSRGGDYAERDGDEELYESAIPMSPYGYWIDDNGAFVVVSSMGDHQDTAAAHGYASNALAMMAGWIRVVTEHDVLNADTNGHATSLRAVSSLIRLAQSQDWFDYYHSDLRAGTNVMTEKRAEFINSVRIATSRPKVPA